MLADVSIVWIPLRDLRPSVVLLTPLLSRLLLMFPFATGFRNQRSHPENPQTLVCAYSQWIYFLSHHVQLTPNRQHFRDIRDLHEEVVDNHCTLWQLPAVERVSSNILV